MKHGFSVLAVAVALMTALSAARAYVSAPVENESYPPPCISENANCSICGTGIGFTDADGDGICDNCRTGTGCTGAGGNGICDNQRTGIGFTDKNNDGICDNRNSHRTGNGQGHKHGCKRGNRQ